VGECGWRSGAPVWVAQEEEEEGVEAGFGTGRLPLGEAESGGGVDYVLAG
jgi:hypothetical protein